METTIRALDRSIDFLDYLASRSGDVRPPELVSALKLPSSTILRIAHTLEARGLVIKHPLTGGYQLGPQLLHYSRAYLNDIDYRHVSKEIMLDLRNSTKETVSLYIKKQDSRVCIEKIDGLEPLRSSIHIGDILPLVSGAAGKVFLAFLNQKRVEVTHQVLETIRRQGFSTSHAEYQAGVSSVAAPIFDFNGNIIAALSVSGPSVRFQDKHLDDTIQAAIKAAEKISYRMGYVKKT